MVLVAFCIVSAENKKSRSFERDLFGGEYLVYSERNVATLFNWIDFDQVFSSVNLYFLK